MRSPVKYIIITIFACLVPLANLSAIDFDQDGYDDFVLIDINSKAQLEWFAIDINDSTRRSLGEFGKLGDHLAVGNWTADFRTSRALIKKRSSGEFEWNLDLPSGEKNVLFGSYPDTIVSGIDIDKNGAIDPALVTIKGRALNWKIMYNPAIERAPLVQEINFGGKNDLAFYANVDGSGDKIAVAKVIKNGILKIRYKDTVSGKIKMTTVGNFRSKVQKIYPVGLANGKDLLVTTTKRGHRYNFSIIKGSRKIKQLSIKGDEIVVGKYLGSSNEVLVVRSNAERAIVVDPSGKKSTLKIDLNGVLVDDVNINSFDNSIDSNPARPTSIPTIGNSPANGAPNPSCLGVVLNSTEHLLYKPVSDTTGNAVLVFDSKYTREFLGVRIELKDGSFAEAWWKGLELWGNPDSAGPRQHWRTNVRASQVKDKAQIIVQDLNQECKFILPGSAGKRWE